jgi:hypothetical protein
MPATSVHTTAVEGLAPMLRALRKMDADVAKKMRAALLDDVGKPFVSDVQERIRDIGLHRTGRLLRSIKTSVQGKGIIVRSSPALNPSPKAPKGYAALYEYRKDRPRPFIDPTMDEWASTGKTEEALGGVLDRFITSSDFQG